MIDAAEDIKIVPEIADIGADLQQEFLKKAVEGGKVRAFRNIFASLKTAKVLTTQHANFVLYSAVDNATEETWDSTYREMALEALKTPGVDVNWRNPNEMNRTPLMAAYERVNIEAVKLLLAQEKIDINATTGEGGYTTVGMLAEGHRYKFTNQFLYPLALAIFSDPRFDHKAHEAHLKASMEASEKDLQQRSAASARRTMAYEKVYPKLFP